MRSLGEGLYARPHGMRLDAEDNIWTTDVGAHTVTKEWRYAGLPCGLYLSPAHDMYMASGFAGQIPTLDADGQPVAATGEPGKGLGQFGEAHYLTFGPGGEIYVADTINAVLHKFVKK